MLSKIIYIVLFIFNSLKMFLTFIVSFGRKLFFAVNLTCCPDASIIKAFICSDILCLASLYELKDWREYCSGTCLMGSNCLLLTHTNFFSYCFSFIYFFIIYYQDSSFFLLFLVNLALK